MNVGILIGGLGRRMGAPKHTLLLHGQTMLERVLQPFDALGGYKTHLIGSGAVPDSLQRLPRISDACNVSGPLAGMLAALRFDQCPWIIVACDMPWITVEAVGWLRSQLGDGAAAVMPLNDNDRVEPLLAIYTPRMLSAMEALASAPPSAPRALRGVPGVLCPQIPAGLRRAWQNANTPDDLRDFSG